MTSLTEITPEAVALLRSVGRLVGAWHKLSFDGQMSRAQFHTLVTLARLADKHPDGRVTVSDIAAELRVSVPAVSQNIRALEQLNYIYRISPPADRRVSYLQITADGDALMRKEMRRLLVQMSALIQSQPEPSIAQDTAALERVTALLEKMQPAAQEERNCEPC